MTCLTICQRAESEFRCVQVWSETRGGLIWSYPDLILTSVIKHRTKAINMRNKRGGKEENNE